MTVTAHDQALVADLRAALAGDVIDRADHRYERGPPGVERADRPAPRGDRPLRDDRRRRRPPSPWPGPTDRR